MIQHSSQTLDKPFKTYDEMLDLLEQRNVVITNREFAKECLSNISYYSLINGYKDLFEVDSNDKFPTPVSFNDFYVLHNFDTTLNNIIFKYIILIEKSLKSKISYIVSENYGVETDLNDVTNTNISDYLCKANYRNNRTTQSVLKDIKKEIKRTKDASIHHYNENRNHLPCWILTNGIPFGLTIKWYEILKPRDKIYICEKLLKNESLTIEEKKEFTKKGLVILRKYRNNIAHGHKIFINSITDELPKKQVLTISKGLIKNEDYINGIGKNDIFAVIIIIFEMIDKESRRIFLNEVIAVFKVFESPVFSREKSLLELLCLPYDFIDKLEKMKE